MTRKTAILLFLIFTFKFLPAQEGNNLIREGNKKYEAGEYEEAGHNYREALTINPESFEGSFNMADALYKQEKYAEAANQFKSLAENASTKELKSKAYHNLGNSLLQAQKLEESIDAYKNALKNNPQDNDTRYNLAYAQQLLKKQQQQEQQQNKDQDKNKKQQNKDDQDQQQNKDDQKQNQDQQKKDKQNDKEQKQQEREQQEQQKKQQQVSKQDAQRLLDALENEERKVRRRLKKQKGEADDVEIEKDW